MLCARLFIALQPETILYALRGKKRGLSHSAATRKSWFGRRAIIAAVVPWGGEMSFAVHIYDWSKVMNVDLF